MFRLALAKHRKSETCHLVMLCIREAPATRPFEPFVLFVPFALTISSYSPAIPQREANIFRALRELTVSTPK